jgi:biotin-dependent carboxylase-like uncharacterized protein
VTVQDLGRPGYAAAGLSQGGAADPLALIEAAALLGLTSPVAGLELAGMGVDVAVSAPTRVALTGAPMRTMLDGQPLAWHATHKVEPGQRLSIGPATAGVYGYLTPAGGIATTPVLGSRAAHLVAGIGAVLTAGETVPAGDDPAPEAPARKLPDPARFRGGAVRVMPGPQTGLFAPEVVAAFDGTTFTRSPIGNRQGVRLDHDGAALTMDGALGIVSDLIARGDVQMTGDGVPYVLLSECQTTGGYPRIGAVVPADLPIVAQAAPGAKVTVRMISLEEADAIADIKVSDLARRVEPLVRDPREMSDLLSYQLVSGAVSGAEDV